MSNRSPASAVDGSARQTTIMGWIQSRGRGRAWPPAVLVGVFYIVYVTLRVREHDVLWLVHLGRRMLYSATSSDVLTPELGWQSEIGYDGQYYYAVAVDPLNAADYIDEKSGYVYARPLYPILARVVALGQVEFVPHAMLAIGVLAVVVGTLAIASWLHRHDVSPWFSLVYGLYPGLVFSVFRDLTEPLAFSLVAVAIWAFEPSSRHRVTAAAVILAFAALTRETVVLFSLAGALALFAFPRDEQGASTRKWRTATTFVLISIGPLLLWKAGLSIAFADHVQERPGGLTTLVPFYGIGSYWPWDAEHGLVLLAVVVPTVVAMLGSIALLARKPLRIYGLLLLSNCAIFVVFLPSVVYSNFGAASRAAMGVVLAVICCLPAWKSIGSRYLPSHWIVAWAWSLPWFVLSAALVGIDGIDLIT
jgi:hypothetical protein